MNTPRDHTVLDFVAEVCDTGHAFLECGEDDQHRFIDAVKDGDIYHVTICHWGMPEVTKHVALLDLGETILNAAIL